MSVTRRLRTAPAAFALVLAALALGGVGGTHLDASTGAGRTGATPAGSTLETLETADAEQQPAVTIGADERVDARADRWRQGALLALLAFAAAIPLLGGWAAGAGRDAVPHTPARWSAVAVRAPPVARSFPRGPRAWRAATATT